MITTSTTATDTHAEQCGQCHLYFPTLGDVFSHPCAGSPTATIDLRVATTDADSVDLPDWGTGSGRAAPKARKANRYAGRCVTCGGWVDAEAGYLAKAADGRWAAEHVTCPAQVPAPTAPAAGQDHRPNRYAGTCTECSGTVPAGEGWLTGKPGAWTTQHPAGQCPAPAAAPAPADGYEPAKGDVHVVEGAYYRVHHGQRSGRLYACRWDGADWDYTPGAMALLSAATVATAEQAAAFGHMFERCCYCTTPIDTPESTVAGYGPKCARKRGLPWGKELAA